MKKKKNTKSGQATVPEKKWKYEEEMNFLTPYMKERPTICPIPTVPAFDNDHSANGEDEIAQSSEGDQETTGTLACTHEVSQQTAANTSQTNPSLTTLSVPTTQNHPKAKRKVQKRNEETPSTVLMKYIIESKKNTPTPDDIEQFMAGITTTLRTFPAKDRAITKAIIFEIVSQKEIEILSRPSTSHSMVSMQSPGTENTQTPDNFQDFYDSYMSPEPEEQTYEQL